MGIATVEPLSRAIIPSKQAASRHYGSHPYFTKRAWNVVQAYIQHFSAAGDVVLDPFGGSGVTAVESLVLRRKAVYVDISAWAAFLARQTAIAPVDLTALSGAFADLEDGCRRYLDELATASEKELASTPVRNWYPKDVPLPSNADVPLVENLFTPRMLHGLAYLRAAIMTIKAREIRDLMLMAFSATLVRINRTFLSARNRAESRGGSAIFSLYRYKVAKQPVELPLWKQFAKRFSRLLAAKQETNRLIGDFFDEGATAVLRQGSATKLHEFLKPRSVDYIYTDPPYGAHISYLDLSTMWAAWLGLAITPEDRASEVIEGGELHKSRNDYQALLTLSLQQMYEVLKPGAWMSLVFAHRDTTYWDALVQACTGAGFQYANTVVQRVGVVWSMHKKKNPLRVLSGELVLNFRKPASRVVPVAPPPLPREPIALVRACCEEAVINGVGASTEELHHAVVPRLLEAGLLRAFSKEYGDLVPVLSGHFEFDPGSGKWHLRKQALQGKFSSSALARYQIARLLMHRYAQGVPVKEAEVRRQVRNQLPGRGTLSDQKIGRLLKEVGISTDGRHWLPRRNGVQGQLFWGAGQLCI